MERQGIMKALTAPMQQLGEFEEILRKIRTNRGVLQVSGCIDPQKPHFISCAAEGYDCRLIITYSDLRARELYENYRFFDRDVLYFPAKDLIFFQADIHIIIKSFVCNDFLRRLLHIFHVLPDHDF